MELCKYCFKIGGYHTDTCTKPSEIARRSEKDLCECDRPDEAENPHRHKRDLACIYWLAGRPSRQQIQRVLNTLSLT